MVSPKKRRVWKLWQSVRSALRSGSFTSRQFSVLVGHFTPLAMVQNELLSLLCAVHLHQPSFLKPNPDLACRPERAALVVGSAAHLLLCALRLLWSTEIGAVDGSQRGGGACRAFIDSCLVGVVEGQCWRILVLSDSVAALFETRSVPRSSFIGSDTHPHPRDAIQSTRASHRFAPFAWLRQPWRRTTLADSARCTLPCQPQGP